MAEDLDVEAAFEAWWLGIQNRRADTVTARGKSNQRNRQRRPVEGDEAMTALSWETLEERRKEIYAGRIGAPMPKWGIAYYAELDAAYRALAEAAAVTVERVDRCNLYGPHDSAREALNALRALLPPGKP